VWVVDPADGQRRLETAIATFENMGATFELARTKLDLAYVLGGQDGAQAQAQRWRARHLLKGLVPSGSPAPYRFGLDVGSEPVGPIRHTTVN
jgi:hypothetical protein